MINKNSLPLVDIDRMNEIHMEEIDILNSIYILIEKEDIESITKQIQLLIEHMQKHFSYEEELMRESSYNMYTIHQADHNKVLNETRYIHMDWRNSKDMDRIIEYFTEQLPDWLDQHIKAMDTPMAEFINNN